MTKPAGPGDRPERITGIRHLFAAASYSVGGLQRLWRETALRHETLAAALILVLFALIGAPLWGYAGFIILFLIVVAAEAINTAIEEVVDHVSPGWAEFAKHAKDLGSFAVACLMLATGVFLALVIWSSLQQI